MANDDWQAAVAQLQADAKLHRKRGDARRRKGEADLARDEFAAGLDLLTAAIVTLESTPAWAGAAAGAPLSAEASQVLAELIEACGARGGLLRRLGRPDEALASYQRGAGLEADHAAASTYNRVNAVKLALISGASRLVDLRGAIAALESLLSGQLAADQTLSSDNAWSWADLGDCRALLGDVPGAEQAYRTFVEKAGSNAPSSTLEVLREIVASLEAAADPGAASVAGALSMLESRLR